MQQSLLASQKNAWYNEPFYTWINYYFYRRTPISLVRKVMKQHVDLYEILSKIDEHIWNFTANNQKWIYINCSSSSRVLAKENLVYKNIQKEFSRMKKLRFAQQFFPLRPNSYQQRMHKFLTWNNPNHNFDDFGTFNVAQDIYSVTE